MRKLILILVLLLPLVAQAGIYNNTGTTAEDSIAIAFQFLDTLGSPVAGAANDSVWIVWYYPGGAVADRDSAVYSACVEQTIATTKLYSYKMALASIGAAQLEGTYKYTLIAHDNSLGLYSTFNGEFQLYASGNLSDKLDSLNNFDKTTGTIGSAQLETGAITATVIAADAIGASEIAADAIGASEISANAIGASEVADGAIDAGALAADAITAAKIADDAIDYGTFAATAPTAWWNQGKTGYSLTTQDWTVPGDVVTLQADTLLALMQRLDSLTNALADANKANLKATGFAVPGDAMTLQDDSLKQLMQDADSTHTLVAALTVPTAEQIVDEWETQSQADPTGFHVNLLEVNSDADAGANLALAFDSDSATAAPYLSLRQLRLVSNVSGLSALFAVGNGTGNGIEAVGGATGTGANFVAGGANVYGLLAQGGDGAAGAYFYGGSNSDGIVATGQGTGSGLVAYGGGTSGDGMKLAKGGTGKDFNATLDLDDVTGDLALGPTGEIVPQDSAFSDKDFTRDFFNNNWIDSANLGPAVFATDSSNAAWNGDATKFGYWLASLVASGGAGSSPWTVAGVDSFYDWLTDYYAHDLDSLLVWACRIIRDSLATATNLDSIIWTSDLDTSLVTPSQIGLWLVEYLSGGGGGSDTTAIKAMLYRNAFLRFALADVDSAEVPDSVLALLRWAETAAGGVTDSTVTYGAARQALFSLYLHYLFAAAYDSDSTTAGSAGDSVLTAITDANKTNFAGNCDACGSGGNLTKVYLLNTADSTVLTAGQAIVSCAAETWKASIQSGAGYAEFNLDSCAAGYRVTGQRGGWTFTVDTIYFGEARTTDTIWASQATITAPSSPTKCTFQLALGEINGASMANAKVRFVLLPKKENDIAIDTSGNIGYGVFDIDARADANGVITQELNKNAYIKWWSNGIFNTTWWEMRAVRSSGDLSKPDMILRLPPIPGDSTYYRPAGN